MMSNPDNADKVRSKRSGRPRKTSNKKNAQGSNTQTIEHFIKINKNDDINENVVIVNGSSKLDVDHCAASDLSNDPSKVKPVDDGHNGVSAESLPKTVCCQRDNCALVERKVRDVKGDNVNCTAPLKRLENGTAGKSMLSTASGFSRINGSHEELSAGDFGEGAGFPLKIKSEEKVENKVKTAKSKCRNTGSKNTASKETKITAYFPVRKSDRKTESKIKEEKLEELKCAILSCKEDGMEVKEFNGKGRGIIAKRNFEKGDFIAEYRGELITRVEALKREEKYRDDSSIGCYMYYFMHQNKHYCVDATEETEYKARLINHSAKEPNCVARVVEVDSRPCIALFSSRRVRMGEELLYNYGDRSKASIMAHPWLINS